MRVDLLSPGDLAWRSTLRKVRHDIYHTPQYTELEAWREGCDPAAVLVHEGRSGLLVPLLLQPLTILGRPLSGFEDWSDAHSPYGYPGPLYWGPKEERGLSELLKAFIEFLAKSKIAAVYLRFHPLLDIEPGPFRDLGELVDRGPTVWIDLSLPEEEQWRQVRPRDRSKVKKSIRAGLALGVEPPLERLARFQTIYHETMSRVGAQEEYFFGAEYFERLVGLQRVHLGFADFEGEMVAGSLYFETNGFLQYHLGGTASHALKMGPSLALHHHVRRWATERGLRVLHLGGGVGSREDTLFRYKAGFSKLRGQAHAWKKVVNAKAYDAAVAQWHSQVGDHAREIDFFPLYRARI